ncbi:hypothetical protein [Streptomyces racemochromogenes]|uniref:hypothetical protein n=1 Tax=Streptomyces racemochromogenes TaxID=67353 RepID=UPI0031F0E313
MEQDRTAIAAAASTLRDTGANVDNTFQGLASFYSAPEAAQALGRFRRRSPPHRRPPQTTPVPGNDLHQHDQRRRPLEGRREEGRREQRPHPRRQPRSRSLLGTPTACTAGYRGADLNKVQDLPWGSQLAQSHRWYDVGHWAKSFLWDGVIMDGIVGTVRGLGTPVGVDGSTAAGQAWTGPHKEHDGVLLLHTMFANPARDRHP